MVLILWMGNQDKSPVTRMKKISYLDFHVLFDQFETIIAIACHEYTMRLSAEQINTIVTTCRAVAGANALVWLYGSRLDDTRHGGDVDLLIEPANTVSLLLRARIKMLLEQILSLPVDVLVKNPGTKDNPFVSIARAQAKLLEITP